MLSVKGGEVFLLGTVVNSLSILLGGLIGSVFKNKISDKYNETIMKALGLCVIVIGLKSALLDNITYCY